MTSYYNTEGNASDAGSDFEAAARSIREAFASLPFEKKISTLLRVELDMFGQAIDAVMSAASKAADRVADALSDMQSDSEQTGSGGEASTL